MMKYSYFSTGLSLAVISVFFSAPSTAEMPSIRSIQNKDDSKYEYGGGEWQNNIDDTMERSRQEGIEQGRDIIEQQQEQNFQRNQELLDTAFPDDYGEDYKEYSEDNDNEEDSDFEINTYSEEAVRNLKGKRYRFEEDGESFRLVPVDSQ